MTAHALDPLTVPTIEDYHHARAADILASFDEGHIWVYGFGSLVHTPGFAYDQRVDGYIRGWRRVWWQGSTDHRGTPESPGRTVTLVVDPSAVTWGAAFRLAGTPDEQVKALAYLEHREKQYDLRERVDVFSPAGAVAVRRALVYIATGCSTANPNYLGEAPLEAIAAQIARSHGPSGANSEYLYKLAAAIRAIPAVDKELFKLEDMVRRLLDEKAEDNGAAVEGSREAAAAVEDSGVVVAASGDSEAAEAVSAPAGARKTL